MKSGCGGSAGEDISAVIRDCTTSLSPEKRLGVSWTRNEMFHRASVRLGEYVHRKDPGRDWGKPFAAGILDGCRQGVDIQAQYKNRAGGECTVNITNFANLFQRNIFPRNGAPGQMPVKPPVNDALQRLSQNLLNEKGQAKDLRSRFDTLELSAEAAEGGKNSPLEEMPEGLLRVYLNQCKVGACLSRQHEKSLMEYRDQLSAFDRTIQEYQDMLDGNRALPEQMEPEDVSRLLDATRAAREQFLQQGAAELNRVSDHNPTQEGCMGKAYSMAAEWVENGTNDTHWQIDTSAGDIYDEIDRALSSAHGITSTFQKGASSILNELRRRGCVEEEAEICFENQGMEDYRAVQRESLFQSVYGGIRNVFKHSMSGTEE